MVKTFLYHIEFSSEKSVLSKSGEKYAPIDQAPFASKDSPKPF